MGASQRLSRIGFDEQAKGIAGERLLQMRAKGFAKRLMDPFLFFALRQAGGQGEMKAILIQHVGISPNFEIALLLAIELAGLAPGHFTGG